MNNTARAARSGDKEKDRAIICPCIYHKDEIAKDGHCHCQLYYRKDAAEKVTEAKKVIFRTSVTGKKDGECAV